MKHFPHLSIIRVIGFLFVLVLFTNCKKDSITINPSQLSPESFPQSVGGSTVASASSISETRIASSWFNINNGRYERWGTQYVAADDNSYAYTGRINKLQRVYLILLDFRFTIPSNAVITNITATVRRFKSGDSQVKDCFVHLTAPHADPIWEGWRSYGVEMANTVTLWPGTETEVSYSQSGSGPNGIFNPETKTTAPYQWTPAMINHPSFGFYLLTSFPNKSSYQVYFDQVKVTVEYSMP